MKRPQNTQANIDMHFPCHNHGHLEEKQLFQGNLASYFVSLNLFSIRAFFFKHPVFCIYFKQELELLVPAQTGDGIMDMGLYFLSFLSVVH